MTSSSKIALFWFRRDLRLHDNAGLYQALQSGLPVLPMFIFDRQILDRLSDPGDARVAFIHDALAELQRTLRAEGRGIIFHHGTVQDAFRDILERFDVAEVYTNRDYEPQAIARDDAVRDLLTTRGISFHTFKDHVIFEGNEVVKDDGKPYTVFTPYSRKWHARLATAPTETLKSFPSDALLDRLLPVGHSELPSLEQMGFRRSALAFPSKEVSSALIRTYDRTRDFPALHGTSRLGVHFRFGTISIREKARKALELNATFMNELIWRDFYSMILQHFPHVADGPFKGQYAGIQWRNDEEEFAAWCEGRTGYPLVDAGMRELNATGFMHNRVRMVAASFLTKHLLIDWRWGEAYFAENLLDYDLASNNGGWQWAAGCGTDAAPYFRIFNPASQLQKFDPKGEYTRRWVPEWGTMAYPKPIVDHAASRDRCLAAYKAALGG